MQNAEDSSKLQPGVAAKIYGIANFFELGVWGRIGCGGLAPIKAQTTGALLRVDWGVAPMLHPVAHHHYYQTLQANRNLAACRAAFSGRLRCCTGKPRPGYRRISGSVAWWPPTTAGSLCFNHPSVGVPPLGTRRQENCPTRSCCKFSMLCFLVHHRFVADEDSGSLTIQRHSWLWFEVVLTMQI